MISLFLTYFNLPITLAHLPCAEFPPSREVYVLHTRAGICQFIVSHSTSLHSSQRHDFIVSNLFWPSNNISPPALRWIPALQRSVYVLHSSTGIPKRICQFMVKACCVAATNDVPVHMSARRAISPTLSPIQSFLTLLFKKIYSRTHQQGRQSEDCIAWRVF